jgi:hypothetical protein
LVWPSSVVSPGFRGDVIGFAWNSFKSLSNVFFGVTLAVKWSGVDVVYSALDGLPDGFDSLIFV